MHRSKVATAEPQGSFPERCLCSETSDVGRLVEKKHSEFGGFFFLTSHPVIEPGGRPGIAATTSYSAQEVAAQSSAGGPLFGHPQSHSPRGTPPLGPARHRQSRVCVRNCWSTSQVCLWTKQLRDHLTTTVKTHSRSHQSRAITVLSASGFSGYSIPARGHFDLFAASPRFQVFS